MDSPTGLFDIDHSKGTVIALEGLDVGVYSLNISVHDGKFTSFGEAMVSVDLVNDEMLANAVIMRYLNLLVICNYNLPYARHYNPRFVYFLPTF